MPVDEPSRRQLARALRAFATGRISNDDLDAALPLASRDLGVRALCDEAWLLYSDLDEYHAVDARRLSRAERRLVAKCLLFLASGLEYAWPRASWPVAFALGVANLLTLGAVGFVRRRWHARRDPNDLWPFRTEAELSAALESTMVGGRGPRRERVTRPHGHSSPR